jgi:hypothetical protein
MNEQVFVKMIKDAFPEHLPTGIDQMWYVDTSMPSNIVFHNFDDLIKVD